MSRPACFAAGVLSVGAACAAAVVAALWIDNGGAGRHPRQAVNRWIKEHRHVA